MMTAEEAFRRTNEAVDEIIREAERFANTSLDRELADIISCIKNLTESGRWNCTWTVNRGSTPRKRRRLASVVMEYMKEELGYGVDILGNQLTIWWSNI